MTEAYPPGRGVPSPLHIQRELAPGFFAVGRGMVALRIGVVSVETSQTPSSYKRGPSYKHKGLQLQSGSGSSDVGFAPGV